MGVFGFIFMILTFIFSGIQLKKNKNSLATAGLILAFVALGLLLFDSVLTATILRENVYERCLKQYASSNIPDFAEAVCKEFK
jgi:hypothetical protein